MTSLESDEHADREFELTNEFATVRVRRVFTRNGVRLEISSPRLGRAIRLDPLSLESLTWQTSETFSEFLRHPFGPNDEPGC
ncbi:MAG: dihydrodiol dehydrogenase [Chloroflexi bacterium]|nr:dihydrodiol dehydrogenase [Chloroflexota bacterium]MBV9134460.1 dihydrodiol dehydrogenase [Chloroflexota bacterium]MBV9892575.1 dihydrodiol dehydrogenase [Chloroflexota bacterium]